MSIDRLFAMNKDYEVEGIIIDYGDFRVKIARAGGNNKKFSKVFQSKMKPYKYQIERDTLDETVASRIMAEAYAEAIFLDMDVRKIDDEGNITYVQGIALKSGQEPIPYNRDNVIDALIKYPEFFRDIQHQANQVSLFRAADLEEDVKN